MNLEELNMEEKLELVDAIWERIRQNPEPLDSSAWHGEVLRERAKRLEEGTERILDWDVAKSSLDEETEG